MLWSLVFLPVSLSLHQSNKTSCPVIKSKLSLLLEKMLVRREQKHWTDAHYLNWQRCKSGSRGSGQVRSGQARPGQARDVARLFQCSLSCSASQPLIYLLFLSSHAEHRVQGDRCSDSCHVLKLMTPSLLICAAKKSVSWGNMLICILPQSLSS